MQTFREKRQTRWGEVDYTRERIDETYTRHTYEGPRDAVIVQIADGLRSTTQCYEFMYRLDSLALHPDPAKAKFRWMRAECVSSNYAGD
jgi:hypothetical protein